MATSAQTKADRTSLDSPGSGIRQDDGLLGDGALSRERLTLAFVIQIRWLLIAGELLVVLICRATGLRAPYGPFLVLIVVAAAFNLAMSLGGQGRRPAREWELALQLAFNILQLSALLFLSGGVANPFMLMLIAPISLSAATLKPRYALILGALAVAAVTVMTFWGEPLPWRDADVPHPPLMYRLFIGGATLSGIVLMGGYAWRAAADAARMELALSVTQAVLAREQRLSALGGLAAAAAHELGTPLATISVVAKELARSAPEGPVREDAELLVSQAERCREILRRLTEEPETDDAVHARMTLLQFANEVIEPHLDTLIRVEAVVTGPPGMRPPEIRRMPEVLHAMTSLVDNAVDFARSEVLVSVRFDQAGVSVEVRDDGPGFQSEVIGRLGQPYVTSRPSGEGSRSGHVGMGLGFFIAKTLLERTGAVMEFHNARRGGAVIATRWRRSDIEAPNLPGGFELGVFDQTDS
jgi:two-component system sensor histidine kinase RegB